MMELDEMKATWAAFAARQDALEQEVRQDRCERTRADSTRALHLAMVWQTLELGLWIAGVIAAAHFWWDHRRVTHLLVTGAVLHLYGIAAVWTCSTRLLLVTRIALLDAPVVTQQRRLAQAKRFRFLSTWVLGLAWWMLWVPCTLVVAKWAWGVDVYAQSPAWVWSSVGVGAVGIAVSVALARHWMQRPVRAAWVQRMVDDMSGRSLAQAAQKMEELARFEAA